MILIVVYECSVLGGHGDLCGWGLLYVSYNAGVDVERAGYVDNALGGGVVGVYLHTVPHIEYFVHFFPFGAAFVLYHAEQRWDGEEVVFHHVEVVNKV